MNNNIRHTEHILSPSLTTGGGQGGGSVLILRFSAIGDVAMTVPVVKAFALANPDMRIIMVSRPFAKAFYEGLAPNVEFHGMDLKDSRYKGVFGLEHVYQDLRSLQPDVVADLHDVLRTKYARLRFRMAGIPVFCIDKHRKGRKALVRQDNKVLVQQPTAFERYKSPLQLSQGGEIVLDQSIAPLHFTVTPPWEGMGEASVGIAPFAAHKGKIYPAEKMEQVIADLANAYPKLSIILFGGGKKEVAVFNQWKQKFPNVQYAGDICKGLSAELQLMAQLKCMVSMDSGNMHMASLVGTPVISIWGATHPLAGFMGWGQKDDDAVQVDMPCRPCSIYGNKPCMRDDYACMNQISPQMIIRKIEKYI